MRIDWFLPALRKTSDGQPAHRVWLASVMRRWFPASWRSNHKAKKRGTLRRILRWLGPSWLYSPVRRISQAILFVAFIWLFFYVCWPYTASPHPEGHVSNQWALADVDQQSGKIDLQRDSVPPWVADVAELYLIDDGVGESLGLFDVKQANDQSLLLSPRQLEPELINKIMLASGEWAISQRRPDAWPSHYTDDLASKELIPADIFLAIDPLVSLSTAIASRQWVWSLTWAAAILTICIIVPRGFCGYVCPLGTLIDLFDWSVGRHVQRFRSPADGWWVHIKYYLLAATLLCACFGVLVSGYVAAIPVITRGFLFIGEPIQSGLLRGWHLVPPINSGQIASICLFMVVLCLGLLQPRFWCKYVCPSGAVFSIGNLFRVTERKVEATCIHCNKCIEVCPFDAIKPDFTTRATDCTQCQTCGGVCPTHAIKFVERGNLIELKLENDPPTGETSLGRRGFLSAAVGATTAVAGAAALSGVTKAYGAKLNSDTDWLPVRPPGSVPEKEFLEMCIRCGECFKACPNNVLQPLAFQQGLEGLWTPHVVADWAGCESSCNGCGQVCPTGAIRALPLNEKRHARMGLALVNEQTCLPFANREACQLCVDECNAAGYEAIEFTQVHTAVDDVGNPMNESGYAAPYVIADKCVGCGLCQTRCFGINVQQRGVLSKSAIVINAGEANEDRQFMGSYAAQAKQRTASRVRPSPATEDFHIPLGDHPTGTPTGTPTGVESGEDPFGLN